MRKYLGIVLGLLLVCNPAFAAAPMGMSGQQSTTTIYPSVIQAPNNLITDIGSGRALIENGNSNILVNPSFEHKSLATSWNISGATAAQESTIVVHGKRSLKLTYSAQTPIALQDSTLYASQFNGTVQGLAMIRIKSDTALSVCVRQNGTTSTTLCVTTSSDSTWGLYKIPFLLGATSSGISIRGPASSTGTTYIDDAFVGAVDLKADVPQVEMQTHNRGTGAFTANNTITGGTVVSSGVNTLFSYDSTTGRYTLLQPAVISFSLTMVNSSGANIQPAVYKNGLTNAICVAGMTANINTNCSATELGAAGDYYVAYNNTGSVASTTTIVTAIKSTNSSTYSSRNSDTDWAACSFSTLAWQGLGTVTSNLKCKRQGSDLLMAGQFTVGTPALASSQVMLPTWNGGQLTIKASTPVSISGRATRTTGAANTVKDHSLILSGGNNFLGISYPEYSVATDPFTNQNGSNMFSTGAILSLENVRIPIEGWENSNVIVGSFKEVPTTPGASLVEMFSFSFGTTNLSTVCSGTPCFLDQIGTSVASLTRSGSGTYALNTAKTYSKLKCTGKARSGTQGFDLEVIPCSNCSTTPLYTTIQSTGAGTDGYGTVMCEATP